MDVFFSINARNPISLIGLSKYCFVNETVEVYLKGHV